jgi:hypothetical protein
LDRAATTAVSELSPGALALPVSCSRPDSGRCLLGVPSKLHLSVKFPLFVVTHLAPNFSLLIPCLQFSMLAMDASFLPPSLQFPSDNQCCHCRRHPNSVSWRSRQIGHSSSGAVTQTSSWSSRPCDTSPSLGERFNEADNVPHFLSSGCSTDPRVTSSFFSYLVMDPPFDPVVFADCSDYFVLFLFLSFHPRFAMVMLLLFSSLLKSLCQSLFTGTTLLLASKFNGKGNTTGMALARDHRY